MSFSSIVIKNYDAGLLLVAGTLAVCAALVSWYADVIDHSFAVVLLLLALCVVLVFWAHRGRQVRQGITLTAATLAALRRGSPTRLLQPHISQKDLLSLAAQVDGLAHDLQVREHRRLAWSTRQQERVAILEGLVQDCRLSDSLEAVVQWLQSHSSARVSILQLAPNGQSVLGCVAPSLPEGWTQALLSSPLQTAAGACFQAISERRWVVSLDVQYDPQWAALRGLILSQGLRACWSLPVFSPGGRILGAVTLLFSERREADPDLLQLAQEAADVVAMAIDRDQNRTALLQAEAGYRYLFEASPKPMWVAEVGSGRVLAVNDQALALYGYTRQEFLALHLGALGVPDELGLEGPFVRPENYGSEPVWGHHQRKDGSVLSLSIVSSALHFQGHDARLMLVDSVDEV